MWSTTGTSHARQSSAFNCRACDEPILGGSAYEWIKFSDGPKSFTHRFHDRCEPTGTPMPGITKASSFSLAELALGVALAGLIVGIIWLCTKPKSPAAAPQGS